MKIRKYKCTSMAFIILKITCKKLFQPVYSPPNFESEPGPSGPEPLFICPLYQPPNWTDLCIDTDC